VGELIRPTLDPEAKVFTHFVPLLLLEQGKNMQYNVYRPTFYKPTVYVTNTRQTYI
jgi:hypothetical protein